MAQPPTLADLADFVVSQNAAKIVPCDVCFLYPTNPDLTNADEAGVAFCWPCTGRRLNTIVVGGCYEEHEEILQQVNYIRSRSEAWRLEVDSTAEGAALRAATINASKVSVDKSGRNAYIFDNIREFLVRLSFTKRLRLENDVDLDASVELLPDGAFAALVARLGDSLEATSNEKSVTFLPLDSCGSVRLGWSSSAPPP